MMTPMVAIPPDAALRTLARIGVRAVPAVRYATGVVGLVAAAMVAARVAPRALSPVVGGVAMLGGMVLLIILTRLANARDHALGIGLRRPALVLAWTVVLATAIVLALMITVTFWSRPTSWRDLGESPQCAGPVPPT